uniref:Chemokine interleukin-8-like domain-containing protein n=1 Tax=Melopsittacus undulatus TaxID=13146 RepID=A0A8C6JFB5_MELUD
MDGKSAAMMYIYLPITCFCSAGKTLEKTEGKSFRCLCDSTHSNFIPPKAIQNVRLNQRGPHCQNVEIIATLRSGRPVCLEPSAPWVRLTVKAILAR